MIKYALAGLGVVVFVVGLVSFQFRAKPEYHPDFNHAFGAFSCLGTICKTKVGILPIAWHRYGRND